MTFLVEAKMCKSMKKVIAFLIYAALCCHGAITTSQMEWKTQSLKKEQMEKKKIFFGREIAVTLLSTDVKAKTRILLDIIHILHPFGSQSNEIKQYRLKSFHINHFPFPLFVCRNPE